MADAGAKVYYYYFTHVSTDLLILIGGEGVGHGIDGLLMVTGIEKRESYDSKGDTGEDSRLC